MNEADDRELKALFEQVGPNSPSVFEGMLVWVKVSTLERLSKAAEVPAELKSALQSIVPAMWKFIREANELLARAAYCARPDGASHREVRDGMAREFMATQDAFQAEIKKVRKALNLKP